jgi:hypothetical protein
MRGRAGTRGMKLFIPAIGDRLTLTARWAFTLFLEHRNVNFAKELGVLPEGQGKWDFYREGKEKSVLAELPAGTVLECDRVYIRTFNKAALTEGDDYDSVTWKVMKGERMATRQRFWVKLLDCLNVEFELVGPDALYRDRVKAVKAVMNS